MSLVPPRHEPVSRHISICARQNAAIHDDSTIWLSHVGILQARQVHQFAVHRLEDREGPGDRDGFHQGPILTHWWGFTHNNLAGRGILLQLALQRFCPNTLMAAVVEVRPLVLSVPRGILSSFKSSNLSQGRMGPYTDMTLSSRARGG